MEGPRSGQYIYYNIYIGPLLCFGALCFCVLASPAGRVFCVFVFWPCSPEGCVLCFRVFVFWAGCNGLCFVFLCFGPAQRSSLNGPVFCAFVFSCFGRPPSKHSKGSTFSLVDVRARPERSGESHTVLSTWTCERSAGQPAPRFDRQTLKFSVKH